MLTGEFSTDKFKVGNTHLCRNTLLSVVYLLYNYRGVRLESGAYNHLLEVIDTLEDIANSEYMDDKHPLLIFKSK